MIAFRLALILSGDFFTGAVLAAALTKFVLKYSEKSSDTITANVLKAEAMLIMTSIIRVGQSKFVTVPIDEDSSERIMNCIQTLSDLEPPRAKEIFLQETKAAFSRMLSAQEKRASEKKKAEQTKIVAIQVDDLLSFRQFSTKATDDFIDVSYFIRNATAHVADSTTKM